MNFDIIVFHSSGAKTISGFASIQSAIDFGDRHLTALEWRVYETDAAQCEARNPDFGGRCQRFTTNVNKNCDYHQGWWVEHKQNA